MKTLLAFLAVNGVLAAANALAAAVVWAAGNAVITLAPDLAGEPWIWYAIGAAALAASIGLLVLAAKGATPWYR